MIPSLLTDSVSFDLDRAVHYALLWGLEGLELRSVGGVHDRVPFVNERKLKQRLMESDLPVVAIHPGAFVGEADDRAAWLNDLAELSESVRFCRSVGCERIVVSSLTSTTDDAFEQAVNLLRRAGREVQRHGIRLCVPNERAYVASTGSRLSTLLDAVDSEAVCAAWDPAEALMCDEDPQKGLRTLGSRIDLVRCRNGLRTRNGWEPQPIDFGDVDWSAQLKLLAAIGYDGPISIDVDVEPQAKEGLRSATELIRLLRSIARDPEHESS